MIFKRFFGKQRKRTPAPEDQDELIRIARDDQDPAVRRDTCLRIKRLPELRDLVSSDTDAGVRDIALAHYLNLLCGREDDGPALQARLDEIAVLEDQRTLEQVALEAREAEIRRSAIAKIANPDVLAKCALSDSLAANRSAAVERLDDRRALDQVVKSIGKKDKRVYRAARQKLKKIVERETLPERIRLQCEDLCEKLERLGRFGHWVQDRAMLDLLDRQWAEIEPEADPNRRARYQDLRNRFTESYEAYRSEHEAQIAAEESRESLRAEHRALIESLRALAALGDAEKIREGLEQLDSSWGELPPLPEKEQSAAQRKFAAARAEAADRLETLTAIVERNARLVNLLQSAEKTLERTRPLDRKQIRSLLEEAEPLLDAKGADKGIAARYTEIREALGERLRKQKTQAEQRLERLPAKLQELTTAVEGGSLKEAEPLYQSIASSIELVESSGLPRTAYADVVAQLRSLAPQVRDLQKWRRWGTDQHRQELCATMEGLLTADIPLEAMSLRLHDLQMEWKGLDKGGSPVNHPLWERFHAASERVYAHCKPFLDAQAAERDANRQQREQLCQELETFLDQVDWERMDWKMAGRAEREMRQAWSAKGPVEGRHRKSLEKRFRSALKRLDAGLADERSRNQAHKRDLIVRIEALAEEPDLGRAIDDTKRLQREWHTTVPARQKDENRLWQRFRAACDAVFARRREQQEAQTAKLNEHLEQRQKLCVALENLVVSDAGLDALMSELRELDERWRDSDALPMPRQATAELVKRWHEAHTRLERRQRALQDEQRRKDMDLLANRAAICGRLERILETETGNPEVLATAEADWQSLPRQRDPKLQAAIESRFKRAVEAMNEGGDKLQGLRNAFAIDGERRSELCLRLEILARVDSPPEHTKERLQFQVTRLTEHMREGEKDPLEARARLLHEWYLCGPAPAPMAASLEERFLRARTAIEQMDRDDEAA